MSCSFKLRQNTIIITIMISLQYLRHYNCKNISKMIKFIFASFSTVAVVMGAPLLWTDVEMGDYNLTSCSGALSCGSTMATYNGVNAKSNGVDQCTGSCCGGQISSGTTTCTVLILNVNHQPLSQAVHTNALSLPNVTCTSRMA